MAASEEYLAGPTITIAVQTSSVGFSAANLKPTTGHLQGRQMERAIIQAVGAQYMEFSGADATTSSFPMAASDSLIIEGYFNLLNWRAIRNTSNTTAVIIPFYR